MAYNTLYTNLLDRMQGGASEEASPSAQFFKEYRELQSDHKKLAQAAQRSLEQAEIVQAAKSFARKDVAETVKRQQTAAARDAELLDTVPTSKTRKSQTARIEAQKRQEERTAGQAWLENYKEATQHTGGGAGRSMDVLAPEWVKQADEWLMGTGKTDPDDTPSLGNRVGNSLRAIWNQYVGGMAGAVSTMAQAAAKSAERQDESQWELDKAEVEAIKKRREEYIRKNGADDPGVARIDAELARWQRQLAKDEERMNARTEKREKAMEFVDDWISQPARRISQAGSTQAQRAEEGLGTVGQIITETGIAGGQMLLDLAVSGGTGAMAPMVARSFGQGAIEAEANGADTDEMVYQGLKQAAVEYIAEKLFAGNPVYDEGGGIITDAAYKAMYRVLGEETTERVLRSAAFRLLQKPASAFGEGLEEIFSDVVNPLVDKVANLLDGGNRDTSMPTGTDLLKSAAVGTLLGGTGQVVESTLNRGRETPGQQLQREAIERAAQERAAETTAPAEPEAGNVAPEETRITPEAKRAEILQNLERLDGMDAMMYLAEQSGVLRDLKNAAFRAVRGADAAAYEQLENVINGAAAAGEPAAIRDQIITELGGTVNGRTDLSDGAGRRDAGAGAGIEAGGVRPEGVGADAGTAGTGEADRGRSVPTAWSSVKEQGFRSGTEDKTIRMRQENTWTDAMRDTFEKGEKLGVRVMFADGDIRVTDDNGKVRSVQGIYDPETGACLVKSDSRLYRPEQTGAHELLHVEVKQDRQLLYDIEERLIERYGREEIEEMVARYAAMYEFAYGDPTTATEDAAGELYLRYMEELAADAAGGISRQRLAGQGAAKYTEDVRSLLQDRRGIGAGAGGMPGESAPGLRYSADDESIFNPENKTIDEILEDIINGAESFERRYLYFGRFNNGLIELLRDSGIEVKDLPVLMNYRDAYLSMESKENGRYHGENVNYHNLGKDGMKAAMDSIQHPNAIIRSRNPQKIELALSFTDYKGRQGLAIVELNTAAQNFAEYIEAHIINSIYGRRGIERYLDKAEEEGRIIKRDAPQGRSPVQYRGAFNEASQGGRIAQSAEESNNKFPTLNEQLHRNDAKPDSGVRMSIDDENLAEVDTKDLRKSVKEDEAWVRVQRETFAKQAMPAGVLEELNKREARLEKTRPELQNREKKTKQERKAARERAAKREKPTRAKNDLLDEAMEQFSVDGRKEGRAMLGRYFDKWFEAGKVNGAELDEAFDKLMDAGVIRLEGDYFGQDVRSNIAGTRIFVPDGVKAEFGDSESWNRFRQQALGNKIYLVNDRNALGIDALYQELQDIYGKGSFGEDTDTTAMLRDIVAIAGEGRAENVSLYEMMERVRKAEGVPVDVQIDEMYSKFRDTVERALYAAGIETEAKSRTGYETRLREAEARFGRKLDEEKARHLEQESRLRDSQQAVRAREYKRRREIMERQAEQKQRRALEKDVMRKLRWAEKMKYNIPEGEMRDKLHEAIDDMNILTLHAANQLGWNKKYNATVGEIVQLYQHARQNDPNFIPSRYLDELVQKTMGISVGDMDIEDLRTLNQTLAALQEEYHNYRNLLDDAEYREIQELVQKGVENVRKVKGSKKTGGLVDKVLHEEMLEPNNIISRIFGYKKGGFAEEVNTMIGNSVRKQKAYIVDAKNIFKDFTEQNADWLRRADGQGKDGRWIEFEVPELIRHDPLEKPEYGDSKKFSMTEAQLIHLVLESENDQNMNHIEKGGRRMADQKLYREGKYEDAFAKGQIVKLSRETIQGMAKELSPEGRELMELLHRYYNQFSPERINPVSQALQGTDKAISGNYAPMKTDSYYTGVNPGMQDATARGVGVMKQRQRGAANATLNMSALDMLERHINQTSRYVGFATTEANIQRILNWQFNEASEDGVDRRVSLRGEIANKWGKDYADYMERLMVRMMNPEENDGSVASTIMNKALNAYTGATLGFNWGVTLKQAMSYPLAATVLGTENIPLPTGQGGKRAGLFGVDEDTINKFTPELAYRKLGYATPEIARMTENPDWMDTNKVTKFLFRGGMITAMDGATVKAIWPWAENKVRREHPELQVGSDEYYQEVAKWYNKAVNQTQPMYDTFNRATIQQHKDMATKTLTYMKTVPLKQANMLVRAYGEWKAGGSGKAFAEGLINTIAASVGVSLISFANALLKNKGKWYRDDDDELTEQSVLEQIGLDTLGSMIGMMEGGSQVYEYLTALLRNQTYRNKSDAAGFEQVEEFINGVGDATADLFNTASDIAQVASEGGDISKYMRRYGNDLAGTVHDVSTLVSKYFFKGLPMDNFEKYLLGIVSWAAPELSEKIKAFGDTTTKDDLDKLTGTGFERELQTRVETLFEIRGMGVDKGTAKELARLYSEGQKSAIPTDTPKTFSSTNGDGDEEKIRLTVNQRMQYDDTYAGVIRGSLDKLVESEAYIEADDKERAKLVGKLYDYAGQTAKAAVTDSEPDKWVTVGREAIRDGVALEDYIAVKTLAGTKQIEVVEYIDGMDLSPTQKGKLLYYTVGTEAKQAVMQEEVDKGGSWGDAYDACAGAIRTAAKKNAPAEIPRSARLRSEPEDDFDPNDGRGYYRGLRLPAMPKKTPAGDQDFDPNDGRGRYPGVRLPG